jgi:hypothetical protein
VAVDNFLRRQFEIFSQADDFSFADPDETGRARATVAALRASEAQALGIPRLLCNFRTEHVEFHDLPGSKQQTPHGRNDNKLYEQKCSDRRQKRGKIQSGHLHWLGATAGRLGVLDGRDDEIGLEAAES